MFTEEAGPYLESALRTAAEDWDTSFHLEGEFGSRQIYGEAASQLFKATKANVQAEIHEPGTAFLSGLTVVAYGLHTVALLAKKQGMDLSTFVAACRGPSTIRTFGLPAKAQKGLAFSLEDLLGMRATDWHTIETKHRQYDITDSGFALRDQDETIDYAALYGNNPIIIGQDGHVRVPAGRCPAPRNGLIKPLVQAMVTVGERDDRLFKATLQKD